MKRWLLVLTLLFGLDVYGATYHVKNSGDNTKDGLSLGNAWQTLAWAQTHTTTGDTILLDPGSSWFEGFETTPAFTYPGDYMTLGSDAGVGKATIDGSSTVRVLVECGTHIGTVTTNLILTHGGSMAGDAEATGALWQAKLGTNTLTHCVLDTHTTDACAAAGGGATGKVIVQFCTIRGAHDDGFTMHGTATGLLEDCDISFCSQGINHSGTAGMSQIVNRCTFHDNILADVADVSVCPSTFTACKFSSAAKLFDGADPTTPLISFIACEFDGSNGSSAVAPEINIKCPTVMVNCTLWGNGKGKMGIATYSLNATNTIFANWNIAANFFTGGTFNKEHCLTYSVTSGSVTSNSNPVTVANPNFTSPSTGDFTLQTGSVAIGAGVAVAGITTDYAGHAWGTPPSVGALEYSSPSTAVAAFGLGGSFTVRGGLQ